MNAEGRERAALIVKHRHLNSTEWTLAAIDSAIEYGDLPDWRELFAAARADADLAGRILRVAKARPVCGRTELAKALVDRLWPGLKPSAAA